MISVVVSCTDRKSVSVAARARLRAVAGRSIEHRVSAWRARLDGLRPSTAAQDLYCGEHWSVARSIADGARVDLVIASAGYGLIVPTSLVVPYAATFAAGVPDSVVRASSALPGSDRRAWWRGLQSWSPPDLRRVTIDELAGGGQVIVAMSSSYLAAMEDELLAAEQRHRGRVLVVSCGGAPRALDGLRLPGDARLRSTLGGSLQALNARVAASLVSEGGPGRLTRASATDYLTDLLRTSSPLPKYERQRLTDRNVRSFIQRALTRDPDLACTPTHRMFRNEGLACEQRRFKLLFEAVKGER